MNANRQKFVGGLWLFGLLSGFLAFAPLSFAETVSETSDQGLADPSASDAKLNLSGLPSPIPNQSPSPETSVQPEPTISPTPTLKQTAPVGVSQLLASPNPKQMGQVTSVSQLSDVQPTDWAFQALQSLVEKYGCIAGYPDGTFRGNRSATRYELAAALNACLDVISDRFATKEDLAAVRKLQEEFAAELATLRGRVDGLEARTAQLEAIQFSTTTKLSGEAIVGFEVAGGGSTTEWKSNFNNIVNADNDLGTTLRSLGASAVPFTQPNPIVVYRTRLNFVTSFTGKDSLITGIQAYGFQGAAAGGNSMQNALFPGTILNSGSSNLGFAPQFAGVDPSNLSSFGSNTVQLYKLLYVFPINKQFTGFAFPKAEVTDAFPQIIPWASEGQGAISRFAGVNPVARLSGGTSGVGLASGAGFIWNPNSKINLTALYGSVAANIATGDLTTGNPLGSGFLPFNQDGSFIAAFQLTFKPTKSFDAALNFAYANHNINILGTGLASSGLLGSLGAGGGDIFALPGQDLGQRVQVTGVGGTFTYRITPKIAFSAYGAGIFVGNIGGGNALVGGAPVNVSSNATYTSFMGGIYFQDAFAQGNTAAFIVGQPLYLEGASVDVQNIPGIFNKARPFHVEAYYRFKISDNISITPGAFVIFNPESNSENRTTAVGLIRTTFTF